MAYEYVSKKEVSIAREEIEEKIHKVQKYLEKECILTFQYYLVGSASNKRHLVTRIKNGNKGFDLDYNIVIQKINRDYKKPKDIKNCLINAFNMFLDNPYKSCENSTSVFTIKKLNKKTKTIEYSFDFAIVDYFDEEIKNPNYNPFIDSLNEEFYVYERQRYIKFNKKTQQYFWEIRKIASNHRFKERYIKNNGLWEDLRKIYLDKKNNNPTCKKSRILYYETVNEIIEKL